MSTEEHNKQRKKVRPVVWRRKAGPPSAEEGSSIPRAAKYAWGLAISLLLAVSLALEQGSPLLPLVNRMIDALQLQTPTSESK